jgi:hypothetical protein
LKRRIVLTVCLSASMIWLCSCAQSTYEWRISLRATAMQVRPPDEPVELRENPTVTIQAHKPVKLLPLNWTTEFDKSVQPFTDLIGYGHEEVRVVNRDGLQPERASSAIAGAIKEKDGLKLQLYADTMRGRFYHALLAEVDVSLDLFLEADANLRIECAPFLASSKTTGSPPDAGSGAMLDKCDSFLAVSFSPSWRDCVSVRGSTSHDKAGPDISVSVLDATGASFTEKCDGEDKSGVPHFHALVEGRTDKSWNEPFPVGAHKFLVIKIKNKQQSRLWGFVSLKFFCALDWNRDASLFMESQSYANQSHLWLNWEKMWGKHEEEAPERQRSLGVDLKLTPETAFVEAPEGRPR